VSSRLLLTYVGLALLVLLVLEVPLGIAYGRNERSDLTGKVERDAVAIASLSEDALQGHGSLAPLAELAVRYRHDTGGRVVLVDRQGVSVVDSGAAVPRDFATRPEIAAALQGRVATGVRYSRTLQTNLLYVAEPIASGGVVHGAVRITYSTSTVDARVTRYWLMLAAIAGLVLALAVLVGLVLARSVTRPLHALEHAAGEAGAGDLSVRAPESGPPEVRSLAASFNEMVRRLQELVGAQEVFVADASHQLRTPLTALRLRLENGDAAGALPEVERLSRLVDGLLALARAEAAPAEPVQLAGAVGDRLDAFAPLAAERGVHLESRVRGTALVGPDRLGQALDNLLANALGVAPKGSAVTVSGGAEALHVEDHGPGMSPEERERAFDRFWSKGTGSGLGLAIVKRLIELDGGTVELREAPGGGLDVVLRLRPALDG
jgi:signal transduction histidine kinase